MALIIFRLYCELKKGSATSEVSCPKCYKRPRENVLNQENQPNENYNWVTQVRALVITIVCGDDILQVVVNETLHTTIIYWRK